jgi:hypothetical protein
VTAMAIANADHALATTPRLVRVFFGFFCLVLAGYVIFGKDFAYLGFPPLYIGEIALALGAATALMAGNLISAILNLPGARLLSLCFGQHIAPFPTGTSTGWMRRAMR